MRSPAQELACPLNGKSCIDGVREDFPETKQAGVKIKCRWWQHLYGKDPQSEGHIDEWDCAVAWLPVTTIETSQRATQTAASVDKVSNEIAELKGGVAALGQSIMQAGTAIREGIEAGSLQIMLPSPPPPTEH